MKCLILFFTILINSTLLAASDYSFNQFDLLGGLGAAKEQNSTGIPASSSVIKLQALTNQYSFLRGIMGFGASIGESINGDFNAGFILNPFGPLGTPMAPYIGVSGVVLTGKFNDEVKLLYGWELNTGINIRLFRGFALTLQFDYLNTGEPNYRYLGGFTFYFKQKN